MGITFFEYEGLKMHSNRVAPCHNRGVNLVSDFFLMSAGHKGERRNQGR